MNVVNFGSLNLDHVYAVDHFCRAGETIHTAGYTQNAGGKGLNQSIAVARSGQTLCHAGYPAWHQLAALQVHYVSGDGRLQPALQLLLSGLQDAPEDVA